MAKNKEKEISNNKVFSLINILCIAAVILPFLISIRSVVLGHIPFWYDPARDLLLAWDNLKKPTLIGPPTGIPGIFYGPYWIWLLSIGVFISKDPRLVLFLALTLPYFLILPLLLFTFAKKVFNKKTIVTIWLLFILGFMSYTNQIWNPYPAPLIFFAIILLVIHTEFNNFNKKTYVHIFLLGILQGLLLNFHISIGLGILLASILFLILQNRSIIKWILQVCVYGAGIILIFLPTLFFEVRHGFNQMRSLVFTLNQAFIHHQAVVGQVGLNKTEIIHAFTDRLTGLLHIPNTISIFLAILLFIQIGKQWWKERKTIRNSERNLLLFLTSCIIGILTVYLTSKNPVWGYHFFGVEVIFVFFLGYLLNKYLILRNISMVWVLVVLVLNLSGSIKSLLTTGARYAGMSAEKADVENIFNDSHDQPFAYVAKNAAIYTYDYDYLFRWIGQRYSFIPSSKVDKVNVVYIIIPKELIGDKLGFVENRTPELKYKTTKEWRGTEGAYIIKREIK